MTAGGSPRSSPSRNDSLEGKEKTSGPSRATRPLQAMCTDCLARKGIAQRNIRHWKNPKPFHRQRNRCRAAWQTSFHLTAGLLQVPQSTGGGTSHASGDRGSSTPGKRVEEGWGCFLHQRCWCHSHHQMVIAGHLAVHVPGAAPGGLIAPVCRAAAGLEEHSLSPRTVGEQVIPPGYLLTWLFVLCKALPFPIHGGTPNWP